MQHFVAIAGGVTREIFLATCLAKCVAKQVARNIASCNMAFSHVEKCALLYDRAQYKHVCHNSQAIETTTLSDFTFPCCICGDFMQQILCLEDFQFQAV